MKCCITGDQPKHESSNYHGDSSLSEGLSLTNELWTGPSNIAGAINHQLNIAGASRCNLGPGDRNLITFLKGSVVVLNVHHGAEILE